MEFANVEKLEYIRENIDIIDIYLGIAEEAAELSAAASKLARIKKKSDIPAREDQHQEFKHVFEKLCDVAVWMDILGENAGSDTHFKNIYNSKLSRFYVRLKRKEKGTMTSECAHFAEKIDTIYYDKDGAPIVFVLKEDATEQETIAVLKKYCAGRPFDPLIDSNFIKNTVYRLDNEAKLYYGNYTPSWKTTREYARELAEAYFKK